MREQVLLNIFIEEYLEDLETVADCLESSQSMLVDWLDKNKNTSMTDDVIDVIKTNIAFAASTCREWAKRLKEISVEPDNKGSAEIDQLVMECKKLHDIIKSNEAAIAASMAFKNRKNADSDLVGRDAQLVKAYLGAGSKLTPEILGQFNLTYQGARLRLERSGVWRNNKK